MPFKCSELPDMGWNRIPYWWCCKAAITNSGHNFCQEGTLANSYFCNPVSLLNLDAPFWLYFTPQCFDTVGWVAERVSGTSAWNGVLPYCAELIAIESRRSDVWESVGPNESSHVWPDLFWGDSMKIVQLDESQKWFILMHSVLSMVYVQFNEIWCAPVWIH